MSTPISLPPRAPRVLCVLILTAGLSALGGISAHTPRAAGAGGASLQEGGNPSESGDSNCPSSNPPNTLELQAGTPQTAPLGTQFTGTLQVALANSDGCPVTGALAGVPVTFTAPAAGAGGRFAGSATNSATVGTDAGGSASAPAFTADTTAGSYTVTAASPYGAVSFLLTNTAAGLPAKVIALGPRIRLARVTARYRQPLQVRVLDADGNPVAGATVSFTLNPGNGEVCGASDAAAAGFLAGASQASASTDSSGLASSPPLRANGHAGPFTATAAIAGKEGAGGAGDAAGPSTGTTAGFSLLNRAGRPATLTAGLGATQSTPAGSRFAIGLAVSVTDAQSNPVAGAPVTFSAPARGASGTFAPRRHAKPAPRATVRSGACGIALAPAFTAGATAGGYLVPARVAHARPAAFALVNSLPGPAL